MCKCEYILSELASRMDRSYPIPVVCGGLIILKDGRVAVTTAGVTLARPGRCEGGLFAHMRKVVA